MFYLPENIVVNRMSDCNIILDLDTSVYYTVELTSKYIIDCIISGINTKESLTKKLCDMYNVDKIDALKDITAFINQCMDLGIVRIKKL